MKENHGHLFKRVAAQVASNQGTKFGTLMREWGLEDFLIDGISPTDSPQQIAARAMADLCTGDLGERDRTVTLTVVQFLDDTVGPPAEDSDIRRRLGDLVQVLKNPCTYDAFLQWANTWYR